MAKEMESENSFTIAWQAKNPWIALRFFSILKLKQGPNTIDFLNGFDSMADSKIDLR